MAFINKFCFMCSVRLGAIVTGILTLVQGIALLGVMLSSLNSMSTVTDNINECVESLRLEGQFYRDVAKDPKLVITVSSTFFSCLICSSLLLLWGCFQMKTICMYPFTFFYVLYIFGLFVTLLLLIFLAKVRGHGLGDLILYSNLGGFVLCKKVCLWFIILNKFILVFYLYTWACVVSLIQIINELRQRLQQKLKVVEKMKLSNRVRVYNKNNTKGFPSYAHFN
ncbi:uncharacterized protein LOC135123527 isoform X1 [Zophobas morio]|uniref:uncharacterized protein LOC135123527 isoform X1 n=1 Tax=Zophobas morio TaxID=2755281 RepID=UPI0030832807